MFRLLFIKHCSKKKKACCLQLHNGEVKNAYNVSRKHMGNVSLEMRKCCWEGNINTNLKEIERKNMEWNKGSMAGFREGDNEITVNSTTWCT